MQYPNVLHFKYLHILALSFSTILTLQIFKNLNNFSLYLHIFFKIIHNIFVLCNYIFHSIGILSSTNYDAIFQLNQQGLNLLCFNENLLAIVSKIYFYFELRKFLKEISKPPQFNCLYSIFVNQIFLSFN